MLTACLLGGIASRDQGKVQAKNRVDYNRLPLGLLRTAHHFGIGALVLAGAFAGLELSSTCHALALTCRESGRFRSLSIPLTLSRSAPLPCKTPLLLLGIIGLAAALLEFEEGRVTLPIKQLQNIRKHDLFHPGHRARDKRDSTLDQVRMKLGSELDPGKVSVLRLLSRDDVSQEIGPGEEPTTTEDIEDVEDGKVDRLRSGLLGFASHRPRGRVDSHGRHLRGVAREGG